MSSGGAAATSNDPVLRLAWSIRGKKVPNPGLGPLLLRVSQLPSPHPSASKYLPSLSLFFSILNSPPYSVNSFKSVKMLFNPAKSLLSRVAGHAVRKPIASVPRVTAYPASLRIQQQQRGMASTGTKDYTVRDALNEALGMLLLPKTSKSQVDRCD